MLQNYTENIVELVHVISSINLNDHILHIILPDRINCSLDGRELSGAMHIDGDEAEAGWPDPFMVVLGGVIGRGCYCVEVTIMVVTACNMQWCM